MGEAWQPSLFGHGEEPAFDASFAELERTELGQGAWVDYARHFLAGHAAVFDALVAGVHWHEGERPMYDRIVEVPRLTACLPEDGEGPAILGPIAEALSARYGVPLQRVTLGYYRDGKDSVAWHGDYILRDREEDGIVATVSVGEPRRFLLRPKRRPSGPQLSEPSGPQLSGGGRSLRFSLGWGDLCVMGGSCQRTWQHCVPKVAHAAPRIAIMFRADHYR